MFHPQYFERKVPNDSERYNYYEWNTKYRAAAAAQVGKETRPLPGPTENIELESLKQVGGTLGVLVPM